MPIPDPPTETTADAIPIASARAEALPRPGVVVIYEAGKPACRPYAFGGEPLCIGRSHTADVVVDDADASRRHLLVGLASDRVTIEDLDSHNGTWVDGQRTRARGAFPSATLLRLGNSLVLVTDDVEPFVRHPINFDGTYVVGPTLAESLATIRIAARVGRPVLVLAESGAGKELAARAYHGSSRHGDGPLVVKNCASLVKDRADAELFGTRRGAFTGAVDSKGALVEAHHGTLFLDELGELDLAVQAKLLRVLEDKIVTPLGSNEGRTVDVQIVCATNADLESMIAQGRFRADLYARVAAVRVGLAPLRMRREEIPWLVAKFEQDLWEEIGEPPYTRSIELVEQCVLRSYRRSNARELKSTVETAIFNAVGAKAGVLSPEHLPPPPAEPAEPELDLLAKLELAIARNGGSVEAGAIEVGVSRAKAYRLRAAGKKGK